MSNSPFLAGDDGHSSLRSTAATAATSLTAQDARRNGRSPSRSTRGSSSGPPSGPHRRSPEKRPSGSNRQNHHRSVGAEESREVEDQVRFLSFYHCLTQSNFEVISAQGGHKGGPQGRGLLKGVMFFQKATAMSFHFKTERELLGGGEENNVSPTRGH